MHQGAAGTPAAPTASPAKPGAVGRECANAVQAHHAVRGGHPRRVRAPAHRRLVSVCVMAVMSQEWSSWLLSTCGQKSPYRCTTSIRMAVGVLPIGARTMSVVRGQGPVLPHRHHRRHSPTAGPPLGPPQSTHLNPFVRNGHLQAVVETHTALVPARKGGVRGSLRTE